MTQSKKIIYQQQFSEYIISQDKLEQLQQTLASLLKQFNDICVKNDIKYTIAGGTCLGAVRHKGFIPWDDDVDILMFPDQIEKLKTVLKDYSPYTLTSAVLGNNNVIFYKLNLNGTQLVEIDNANFPFEKCINIDIFPLENYVNNKFRAKKRSLFLKFYKGLLATYYNCKYPSQLVVQAAKTNKFFKKRIRAFRFWGGLAKLIGPKRLVKLINKQTSYNKDTGKVCVPSSFGYQVEVYDKSLFENLTIINFGNVQLSIMRDYDKYLSMLYGNYMQIPPKEKQEKHLIVKLVTNKDKIND